MDIEKYRQLALSTPPLINDTGAYDARLLKAQVAVGNPVIRFAVIHLLTPEENNGMRHVFIELVDSNGKPKRGDKATITNANGVITHAVLDKGLNEPGTNFPLGAQDTVSVTFESHIPSDVVFHINTWLPENEARRIASSSRHPMRIQDFSTDYDLYHISTLVVGIVREAKAGDYEGIPEPPTPPTPEPPPPTVPTVRAVVTVGDVTYSGMLVKE